MRPSWTSNQNTSYPNASYQVSCRLAFRFRRSEKIDFQDGGHRGHFGFPISTSLDIFYLQVTPMLTTKFQVNWPFQFRRSKKKKEKKKKIFKMAAILDFQSEQF